MSTFKPLLVVFWLTLSALPSRAHEGHGLAGGHWHATDTAGFVLALAAAGVWLWWRGRP